jgi:hypothetical protein
MAYELGSLAFVAVGVFFVTKSGVTLGDLIINLAAIGFFGLCSVVIGRRFLDSGYVLTIDEAGIFDRRATDRLVPWSVIANVGEMQIRSQRFYLFELSQPARQFINDRFKRFMSAMNRPWVRNGFFVGANGLNVSYAEIGSAIQEHRTMQAPTSDV